MGTLYDVLQVSPEADPEIIRAAYERLSSTLHGHDENTEIRRKALDEAFFTLATPEKRQRYDQRLSRQNLVVIEETARPSLLKMLILGVIGMVSILGYLKYNQSQENARLERERLVAEQRKAEMAMQQEKEQRQAETDRLRSEQLAEQQQRYAFERARREADATMRINAAADERSRREAERRQQDADRQLQLARQNEQREAQRRLEREKALARQLEAENSRTKRIY